MTFQEVLIEAGRIKAMPRVKINKPLPNTTSFFGTVTSIKQTENYHGISVRFDEMDWDNWFYAEDGTDKRKHYMSELEICIE